MNYQNLYKCLYFLPVKTSSLEDSVSSICDGLPIPLSQINANSIEFSTEEFGKLETVTIPKDFYFNQMKKIKNMEKIDLINFIYIPFQENDNLYLMYLFSSKFIENRIDRNVRYISRLDSDYNLKFCNSYNDACLVLLSYFKILQGRINDTI
jgi:hypothetical protein